MSTISRSTNNIKSAIFQKLLVMMIGVAVFSTVKISNDEFIQSMQCMINAEYGKDMISSGVYGK